MTPATDRFTGATVTLQAPAKVNLFLEVTARRADGYHDIDSVMVAVNLFDLVDIVIAPRLSLTCTDPALPTGSGNLAIRAAEALQKATRSNQGAHIYLTKRIPAAAGLAGGSSDAAATLKGLNRLWKLKLSNEKLASIAADVGSDVAFFFHTPAARCTGRGEIVEPLTAPKTLHLVLVCPVEGLSTAEVYRGVKVPAEPRCGDSMSQALQSGDAGMVGRELFNRLQEPAEGICPRVRELHGELLRIAPGRALMSGSGSSLFVVCDSAADADELARRLRAELTGEPAPRVFAVRTCESE